MNKVENQVFDEERALYGSRGIEVISCRFDGPADGESALKESRDIDHGAVFKAVESINVDRDDLFGVPVCKASLRQTPV